jgi:predicted ATPase/DNA-binding CsgD family transcriptional regulator
MAVHTGEAEQRDERNYGGLALIRCARLRALAGGGQVLVSSTAAALAHECLPDGLRLVELDAVPIADFAGPERVHQLCHPDLPGGLAPLRRPLARLPVWPTPLVGREQERRALAALCESERLVTVTGAGGSGKTRLAHAVAEDLRDHFVGGVVWVELARLGDAAQVAGAVLAACGAQEMPGIPALDVLTRHFAGSELLLVLDNCEHLLGASAEVADAALRSGGRVRVLATSREPLGVAGETSWRIPSLALPEEGETDPERLAASDAVQLFVARARAARPDFRLEAANAACVARICRRLDGIPLALELAAARVRTLSLERLAAGLDDRFRLLTGGARTAVARQRTLLASVEWSHDLLDEEERTLLHRLAVFAAPFSLEAAEAVAADEDIEALSVLELLARLVDKSLVVHADDRYRMLETIRSYALARAADAGELELLRDRHLAWFQLRARGWRLDREIASRAVLDDVGGDAPDLIAAAEWCGSREGRLPSELLHALAQHWAGPKSFQEARSAGMRLLGALAIGSREWVEGVAPLARVLWHAGELGWYAPAQEALGSELDPVTRAFLETGLSLPSADAGNAEALETLRRAGEVGREAGNSYLELTAKLELLIALLHTGDVAEARPLLAWAERSTPPSSWPRSLVANADELLALLEGDFSRAKRELAERTLDSLWLGALMAFLAGDVAALEQRLRELERISDVGVYEGIAECVRGLLACARDELAAAVCHFERSRAQMPPSSGFALYTAANQAHIVLALGDTAAAEALLSSIQAGMSNRSLHMIRARAEVLAAYLARRRGDLLEAESRAQSALTVSTRHGGALLQLQALEVLALLAGDRDELDLAGRLLGAEDAFRERSGFRWREHHARSAFEALRARVPEAALVEGAALSVAEAAAYAARGRGERGRPDHGWASLTPSERRVVELVAEGLPNAAIAKRLFVSLATVKTHLVHVYGKLGLATRAELAAAATRRRLEGEST